jgi:AcrR family transcriptional regulator
MAESVKGRERRRYNSPRRVEQAAATRRAILEAAQRLFEKDGYAATTMAAIAEEAGVALKTVYVAFETKSGVLRALWNMVLRGDLEDTPMDERPAFLELLAEPDPERQLKLNAAFSTRAKQRLGTVAQVIFTAAPTDPEIEALAHRIGTAYRETQRQIVKSLAAKKALKRGLGVERAADILWTINHPEVWHLLVGQRGWSPKQYERWSADAACSQLLRDHPK